MMIKENLLSNYFYRKWRGWKNIATLNELLDPFSFGSIHRFLIKGEDTDSPLFISKPAKDANNDWPHGAAATKMRLSKPLGGNCKIDKDTLIYLTGSETVPAATPEQFIAARRRGVRLYTITSDTLKLDIEEVEKGA